MLSLYLDVTVCILKVLLIFSIEKIEISVIVYDDLYPIVNVYNEVFLKQHEN